MTDQSPGRPAASGFIARCLRLVVTLGLVLGIAALGVATVANWRRAGRVTFHVFDARWWGVGRTEAEPYVAGARTAADQAYTAVWGDGGLADQAERWLDGLRRDERDGGSPIADGATTTAQPADATMPADPAAALKRCEQRFRSAEASFRSGLAASKRAAAASGDAKRASRDEAIRHFIACRGLLTPAIATYRTLPEHRVPRLAEAEELGRLNQRFLQAAEKEAGGP
jgi:hypothetical protein